MLKQIINIVNKFADYINAYTMRMVLLVISSFLLSFVVGETGIILNSLIIRILSFIIFAFAMGISLGYAIVPQLLAENEVLENE